MRSLIPSQLMGFSLVGYVLPVVLFLGEGVVVVVMDPLLFQGQSLDLQLGALGLLHGLKLMCC